MTEHEELPPDEPIMGDEQSDDPLAAALRERDEWKEIALRHLADLENAKRRFREREQDLVSFAAERMILKMLPVLDDLHAAAESAKQTGSLDALRDGIEMIYHKAMRVFEEAGVRTIESDPGHPFDVDVHEALMHTPSDHPEGHVVQTVQRGYFLHDKVIRHAKVVTSAGSGDQA